MTEQLKPLPCPFCGSAPKTSERPDNIDGTRFFYAVVCYCGGYSACAHKMAVEPTPEQAKHAAIEAWNRRAQAAQAVPVLTEREIEDMYDAVKGKGWSLDFARAIEQAVRAKMGVAVPMTDEQVADAVESLHLFTWGPDAEWVKQGIRYAEKFHGIVGKEGA